MAEHLFPKRLRRQLHCGAKHGNTWNSGYSCENMSESGSHGNLQTYLLMSFIHRLQCKKVKSNLVMNSLMSCMHAPWKEQKGWVPTNCVSGSASENPKDFLSAFWKWLHSPWLLGLPLRCALILFIRAYWNWQHLLGEVEFLWAGESHAYILKELLFYLRKQNILLTMRVLNVLHLHPTSSIHTKSQSGERLNPCLEIKWFQDVLPGTGILLCA